MSVVGPHLYCINMTDKRKRMDSNKLFYWVSSNLLFPSKTNTHANAHILVYNWMAYYKETNWIGLLSRRSREPSQTLLEPCMWILDKWWRLWGTFMFCKQSFGYLWFCFLCIYLLKTQTWITHHCIVCISLISCLS